MTHQMWTVFGILAIAVGLGPSPRRYRRAPSGGSADDQRGDHTNRGAMLIPVVLTVCNKTGLNRKRMLMPLCVAVMISGTMTLIASAPNIIIVTSFARRELTRHWVFQLHSLRGRHPGHRRRLHAVGGTHPVEQRTDGKDRNPTKAGCLGVA